MKSYSEYLTERKPMDKAARKKKARQMARLMKTSRMQKKIAKAKMKIATPDKLLQRAQKAAKLVIMKKSGVDNYTSMSSQQRMEIDKRMAKKLIKVPAIAKKLVRKLKAAEADRVKAAKAAKKEQ